MSAGDELPGTAQHQRVLRAIVEHYAGDPRVLAIALFGSLARGNWDHYSDLDLDVVLEDGASIALREELERLCAALAAMGERCAAVVPQRADEGDIVLASLLELSIRYHPLNATSPNIVSSLHVLRGRITADDIRAAGRANERVGSEPLEVLRDRCVRALLEADVALLRHRLWFVVEQLARARDQVFALFAAARNAPRPLHSFQEEADERWQAHLAATLPTGTLASAQQALLRFLDLLERDLVTLTRAQITLSEEQREVLRRIRGRQATLALD